MDGVSLKMAGSKVRLEEIGKERRDCFMVFLEVQAPRKSPASPLAGSAQGTGFCRLYREPGYTKVRPAPFQRARRARLISRVLCPITHGPQEELGESALAKDGAGGLTVA